MASWKSLVKVMGRVTIICLLLIGGGTYRSYSAYIDVDNGVGQKVI